MTTVDHVHEDNLIKEYEAAQEKLRKATFPALFVISQVDEDGEPESVVTCPRCGDVIREGTLFAISPAEQWAPNEAIESGDDGVVMFYPGERPDLEATLYYKHGDNPGHAVSLPEGWDEEWL